MLLTTSIQEHLLKKIGSTMGLHLMGWSNCLCENSGDKNRCPLQWVMFSQSEKKSPHDCNGNF